jgi:thiamine pyrophosphate-dependent acetolactate synthase large subunit-like protein
MSIQEKSILIAKIIIESIIKIQQGKGVLFGLAGSHWVLFNQVLMSYINNDKIDYIHVTSEYIGCFAATGYAISMNALPNFLPRTQRVGANKLGLGKKIPGLLITTSGPGILMAMTGMASALREESALVVFSTISINDYEFQFVDPDIVKHVTKSWFMIHMYQNLDEINSILKKAYHVAIYGTLSNPGPGTVVIYLYLQDNINQTSLEKIIHPYLEKQFINSIPIELDITSDSIIIPPKKLLLNDYHLSIIKNIISFWNKPDTNAVVIRIGYRIDEMSINKLLKFVLNFDHVYLTLTYGARGKISPRFKHSLDLDGPLGNDLANAAIKKCDLVLEFGLGAIFELYVNERDQDNFLNQTIIRIYDDGPNFFKLPDKSLKYQCHVNEIIDLLTSDECMNELNTKKKWIIDEEDKLIAYSNILFKYIYNNNQPIKLIINDTNLLNIYHSLIKYSTLNKLTVGQAVSLTIAMFYDHQPYEYSLDMIKSMIFNHKLKPQYRDSDKIKIYYEIIYNYQFVMDTGAATFMAGQLARMNEYCNSNLIMLSQFSPMSGSYGLAVGSIYANKKDTILLIGDGSFFMMLSGLIDLNIATLNTNTRLLLIIFDDDHYANVTLDEIELYGNSTKITETIDLKKNLDYDSLLSFVKPVEFRKFLDLELIKSFRDKNHPCTKAGLYIIMVKCITSPLVKSTINI